MDTAWHLLHLFIPGLGLGALAAASAKLLWWRELRRQPWWRLAVPAALAACGVTAAGLLLWGQDGRMSTYAAMVAASALTLWWQGFGPGRR